MRRALWILGGVALVAVLAIGIMQAGGDDDEPRASRTADVSNPGQIKAADVKAYEDQLAQYKGAPVVVNAWASWCGPCKLEMPIFRDVALELDDEVQFVGLNVSDNRKEAERFLAKEPVPYDSLEDGDARIVQSAGGSGGLPVTIFYDKNGKRAFIHQGGYTTKKKLLDDIKRYTGA